MSRKIGQYIETSYEKSEKVLDGMRRDAVEKEKVKMGEKWHSEVVSEFKAWL